MKALLCSFLLVAVLTGCSSKEEDVAACSGEAVKALGQLRKPHPVSGWPWPSGQEIAYVSDCMRAKGYTQAEGYTDTCSLSMSVIGDGHTVTNPGPTNAFCWEGRYERLLPKGLRRNG